MTQMSASMNNSTALIRNIITTASLSACQQNMCQMTLQQAMKPFHSEITEKQDKSSINVNFMNHRKTVQILSENMVCSIFGKILIRKF